MIRLEWITVVFCVSIYFNVFFIDRRVCSGSGVSVTSTMSVEQRLPEEPVLEEEQQQLEKKLPGERKC